jgi:hypothetical protein
MNCSGVSKDAVRLIREGIIEIYPKGAENDWYRWLETDQR